jgi:hypothetical protein
MCAASADAGTALSLHALRERLEHKLPMLPERAGLCSAHQRFATRGIFYPVKREGDRLTCLSLVDGTSLLCVEYAPKQRRSGPSRVISHWRKQLLPPGTKCLCGALAVEVGHRIPLLCFRIAGLNPHEAYFDGNLDPVCRQCNIDWMHFCDPTHGVHSKNTRAVWQERRRRLSYAIADAKLTNIRVPVPETAPRCGWPGNPVFSLTKQPLPAVVEPVAFVDDLYYRHVRFLRPSEMKRPLRLLDEH